MAAFKALFGDQVVSKTGMMSTENALSGKSVVGIYFSAHWCGPCRGFTPKLAEMYEDSFQAKGMEIVFVSSDRDDKSFTDYYNDMPWLALPFDNEAAKEALNKKFRVSGIPSLVILNASGEVITKDGREAVMKDPKGEKYPWTPPTAAEKAKIILSHLGEDLVAQANGKPIGLYFSAHWCPPCRGFTPQLAKWYNDGLKEKMEIIFISSDRDKESYESYKKEMPWLALPYAKRSEKEALSDAVGCEGIPTLAVINPDGTFITTDGRSKVAKDPKAENFPEGWLPQPFNDVNNDPSPLNEERCLIALGDADGMRAAVKEVANEYYLKSGKVCDDMTIRFFCGPDGGVTGQIRNLTKLQGNKLVLLDIPDDGAFYVCESDDVSPFVVKQFLKDIDDKKVERKQLQK